MKTFPRGIHPGDNKENTNKKEIVTLAPPKELVFPMSQHIGAPAKPCVAVGDRVLMGQKIGEADGYMSANIHSSVSGTVKAIEKRVHPTGYLVKSIVIENDGLDEKADPIPGHSEDYETERDNFMTANQALEYGLIDKVIEHR